VWSSVCSKEQMVAYGPSGSPEWFSLSGASLWPTVTDRVAWSGSLSVTLLSRAKMVEAIEMPFRLRTWVGPRNHVLEGVQIFLGKGQFLFIWVPIVKYMDFLP